MITVYRYKIYNNRLKMIISEILKCTFFQEKKSLVFFKMDIYFCPFLYYRRTFLFSKNTLFEFCLKTL